MLGKFAMKIAAVTAAVTSDDKSYAGEAALAGLAASPLLGLIGKNKAIHDPLQGGTSGRSFRSLKELQSHAQPGDVLLTTKPKGSMWKTFISPVTGSEFYHAEQVVGFAEDGTPLISSAGYLADPSFRGSTIDELKKSSRPLRQALREEKYRDVVLMRPKDMSPAQRKAYVNDMTRRSARKYDSPSAIKAWLNQMFVPKLEAIRKRGKQVVCEGNVCSTLPAQSFEKVTGKPVAPGVSSRSAFASDFLSSPNFEQVGYKVDPRAYGSRKWGPLGSRLAMGAGMAGTAYGLSEEPEILGGVAGAPAALYGAHLAAKGTSHYPKFDKGVRSLMDLPLNLLDSSKSLDKRLKHLKKARIPLAIMGGGAALGYGASKGLSSLLGSKKEP